MARCKNYAVPIHNELYSHGWPGAKTMLCQVTTSCSALDGPVQKFELCGAEAKIILLSANRGMLANFHL
jgi:hypothetical protein